ncbi:MAG: RnfH family protein [Gammaproteobacteria bacterium]|nr:RnfH family protein [Gammaproteobacteria bacterium]
MSACADQHTQADDMISVELVYALPQRQSIQILHLPKASSVTTAVQQSGLLQQHPELMDQSAPWQQRVGIFGRMCAADRVLQQGDRIEIYRPLLIDPKEARRQRAKAQQQID